MSETCKNCGEVLAQAKGTATCDLTGYSYETSFGTCDCDLGLRMSDFAEKPEVASLNLPKHIQEKLDALNELEEMNMALGLHDKISSARSFIQKEIDDYVKNNK
jgi:uncharacterized Zn finger protein (UPF0148 family)